MTQGERGNMNNLTAMKETESIMKSLPTTELQAQIVPLASYPSITHAYSKKLALTLISKPKGTIRERKIIGQPNINKDPKKLQQSNSNKLNPKIYF